MSSEGQKGNRMNPTQGQCGDSNSKTYEKKAKRANQQIQYLGEHNLHKVKIIGQFVSGLKVIILNIPKETKT